MRRNVCDLLRLGGDEFREAGDGAVAEAIYAEQEPDWVIMDLQMQPVGGLAATRRITSRFPNARIVILTQHDDPELRTRARQAGACAFLTKDELGSLPAIVRPSDSVSRIESRPA